MHTTQAILAHKYDSPSWNVSYVLFQPEHTFSFAEGQFCMIEAAINDKIIKKPYSIASTNRLLSEEKLIWFVVKKASENGMSDFLTKQISIGDTVTLKWPVGHYIDPKKHQNYLFVSTWSGLSPNFWLFQHLVYETAEYNKIINLFWERTSQDLIPYITERFFDHGLPNVHTTICLSQEHKSETGYSNGYVQNELASATKILWTATSCFVCWNPAIVSDVVYQLTELGVAREDIIVEKY